MTEPTKPQGLGEDPDTVWQVVKKTGMDRSSFDMYWGMGYRFDEEGNMLPPTAKEPEKKAVEQPLEHMQDTTGQRIQRTLEKGDAATLQGYLDFFTSLKKEQIPTIRTPKGEMFFSFSQHNPNAKPKTSEYYLLDYHVTLEGETKTAKRVNVLACANFLNKLNRMREDLPSEVTKIGSRMQTNLFEGGATEDADKRRETMQDMSSPLTYFNEIANYDISP